MLIKSEKLLEFLYMIRSQDQANVADYENFHQNKLADIRNLDPMDAFLYGVGSGKLQKTDYIIQLIEAGEKEFD